MSNYDMRCDNQLAPVDGRSLSKGVSTKINISIIIAMHQHTGVIFGTLYFHYLLLFYLKERRTKIKLPWSPTFIYCFQVRTLSLSGKSISFKDNNTTRLIRNKFYISVWNIDKNLPSAYNYAKLRRPVDACGRYL